MKHIFFIISLLIIACFDSAAQRSQSSYIGVTANAGYSQFIYTIDNSDAKSKGGFGYGLNVDYRFYFDSNWGIISGLGLNFYDSSIKYSGSFEDNPLLEISGMIDYDMGVPSEYNTRYILKNWREQQRAFMLAIPVMISYQTSISSSGHKFNGNNRQRSRYMRSRNSESKFHVNIGGKLLHPAFGNNYSVLYGSELTVLGYYPEWDINFGNGTNLVAQGFGVNKNIYDSAPYNKQKLTMKSYFAISGEVGLILTLDDQKDFLFGITVDYGLNNIQKENKNNEPLLKPAGNEHRADNNFIGDHTVYNGFINSSMLKNDKINTFFFGIKMGMRFKL